MPPPSSDKRRWWLDENASSKVEIPKPPGEGWVLNPNRPRNPFDATDEPDWIKVTAIQLPISDRKMPPLPPPRRQESERIPPAPPQKPDMLRRPSSSSLDGKTKPPAPPKPSFLKARDGVNSRTAELSDDEKPVPPLPPRRESDLKSVEKNREVGLLMDDDEADEKLVGGWVPLQPSKEL